MEGITDRCCGWEIQGFLGFMRRFRGADWNGLSVEVMKAGVALAVLEPSASDAWMQTGKLLNELAGCRPD